MSDDNTADLLLAARDVYAEQGGGSSSASYHRAPYCALGALRVASGITSDGCSAHYKTLPQRAVTALIDAVPDVLPFGDDERSFANVTFYNDITLAPYHRHRRDHILDLFDEAIRIAKDSA